MKPIRYKAITDEGQLVEGWYLETLKNGQNQPTIYNDERFYYIDPTTLEPLEECHNENIAETIARMQRELDTYNCAILALYELATSGERVLAPQFDRVPLLNIAFRNIEKKLKSNEQNHSESVRSSKDNKQK